jgi:hypothetical protein
VAPLVKAAIEKGRLTDFPEIERDVLAGRALLWIAWNGEKIKAAAVTELGVANGEKFCTIVACGGHDRSQWLHLLAVLEAYGEAEGCAAMRIYGRRGWLKLLPDYRTTRVLLEKKLPITWHARHVPPPQPKSGLPDFGQFKRRTRAGPGSVGERAEEQTHNLVRVRGICPSPHPSPRKGGEREPTASAARASAHTKRICIDGWHDTEQRHEQRVQPELAAAIPER